MTQTLKEVVEKAVKKLLIDHTNAEHPAYIAKVVRKWMVDNGWSQTFKH